MGRKPKSETLYNLMFQSPSVHETTTSIPVTKRNSKVNSTSTRQSQRLKKLARLSENRQNESVNEPINLDESEREDELEIVQVDEPIPCGKTLEEKVDQLVEDVEILKWKVNQTDFSSDGSSELNYKTLYIRSQKKIQSLAFENGKLNNQLLIARAKIEKHENGKDFVAKLKEVLESNLTKATETLVQLSSQAVFAASPSQPDCVIAPKIQANEKRHKKPVYPSQPDRVIAPEIQANEKRHKKPVYPSQPDRVIAPEIQANEKRHKKGSK